MGDDAARNTVTGGGPHPWPATASGSAGGVSDRSISAPNDESRSEVRIARGGFALLAGAGALFWAAVFLSEGVRTATLGSWDPRLFAAPDVVFFVGGSLIAAATGSRVAGLIAASWSALVTLALGAYGLVEQAAGWGVVLMIGASFVSIAGAATLWCGYVPRRWYFVGPFSFRVAPEAGPWGHLRRSLTQVVVFWSFFFLVAAPLIALFEERLRLGWTALDDARWDRAGAMGFIAGSALGLWACFTMSLRGHGTPLPAATARELVQSGPYRLVRNPMAVGGVIQMLSLGLWMGSWLVMVAPVGGALVWEVVIRPGEEADLAARFGAPYLRYRHAVRRWIPRWPPTS